tara:strand:+ start:712 stop:2535 length:1824 start_codon:yes stop_codon:yes gene_type:complete
MIAAALRSLIPAPKTAVKPAKIVNQSLSLTGDPALWDLWGEDGGGRKSAAGVRVTHKLALSLGPVMCCVGKLSGDNAKSSLHVHFTYKKPGDDTIDQSHPADKVCSQQWNDKTSAYQGWSTFGQHVTLYGRGFALIERDHTSVSDYRDRQWGRVTGLYNLLPDRTVQCQMDTAGLVPGVMNNLVLQSGDRYYTTDVGGKLWAMPWQDVLHVNWMNVFGCEFPMLELMRDEIGHKLAARGFQSKFFSNGAQAGGFVTVPPEMTAKSRENLKKMLHKKETSVDAHFKVQVLADGAKFHQVTIDPKSSEMSMVDNQVARNVAMMYRIPPQELGLEGSDSYGAGESARLSYVNGVLNDLGKSIAGECEIKLLSPKTRRAIRGSEDARAFRHDYSELTLPDWSTRVDKMLALRAAGIYNANDVLFRLGEKLREDADAEAYFNPNTTAGEPDKEKEKDDDDDSGTEEETEDDGDGEDEGASQAQGQARRRLHVEAVSRAAQRLSNLSTNRCKRLMDFQTLVTNRFGEFHGIFREEMENTLLLTHGSEAEHVLATAEDAFFEGFTARMTSTMAETDFATDFDPKALRSAVKIAGFEFAGSITGTLADGVLSGGA